MLLVPSAAGRSFRIVALFGLMTLLAGCAVTRPNPSWQVPVAPGLEGKETVYYVTDRVPIKPAAKCDAGETLTTQPMYGTVDSAAGSLLYGESVVQLPPVTEYGDLVPYRPRAQCLKTPSDPVFLSGPLQQERAVFFAGLREAAAAHGGKQVLVFVHGYDFEFDEAVLWTAELKRYLELDSPLVVYDWASRGDMLAYREDEQEVERSVPRLEGFLRELRAELGEVPIDLMAHSLGNRLLLDALQRMSPVASAPRPFRNLILAAPDIASAAFLDQIAAAARSAQRTTLYVSSVDRALLASQRLHKDLRAGRDLILVPQVDTIDVSPVDSSRTRHSYYIENRWVMNDIYQLLRDDTPPARRFGLVPLQAGKDTFWQLRP